MSPIIRLTLPIRIVSEANVRECWQVKHRRSKSQRAIVKGMLHNLRPAIRGHEHYVVSFTRIAPRPLDGDNNQRGLKSIRDQVAEEIGIDDGSDKIEWQYFQEKGPPKRYAVRIEIQ